MDILLLEAKLKVLYGGNPKCSYAIDNYLIYNINENSKNKMVVVINKKTWSVWGTYLKYQILEHNRILLEHLSGGVLGVVDFEFKTILPFKYVFIGKSDNTKNMLLIDSSNNHSVSDMDGTIIFKYSESDKYDKTYLSDTRFGTFIVRLGNKVGVVDINKNVIVPCKFDGIVQSSDYYAVFIKLKGNRYNEVFCGMYAQDGTEVIPTEYSNITDITNDLVIIKSKGLYGLVNVKTRIILLQCKYASIHAANFEKKIMAVNDSEGKNFYINDTGKKTDGYGNILEF